MGMSTKTLGDLRYITYSFTIKGETTTIYCGREGRSKTAKRLAEAKKLHRKALLASVK